MLETIQYAGFQSCDHVQSIVWSGFVRREGGAVIVVRHHSPYQRECLIPEARHRLLISRMKRGNSSTVQRLGSVPNMGRLYATVFFSDFSDFFLE